MKCFVNPHSVMTKRAFRLSVTGWMSALLFSFHVVALRDLHYIRKFLPGLDIAALVIVAAGLISGVVAVVFAVAGQVRKEPDECNIRPIVLLLALFSVPTLSACAFYLVMSYALPFLMSVRSGLL